MAAVSDPDGTPTDVTWQWARGNSTGGPFDDISGATSATYTTVADDVGNFLQITASYTDPEGIGQVRHRFDWPGSGRQHQAAFQQRHGHPHSAGEQCSGGERRWGRG